MPTNWNSIPVQTLPEANSGRNAVTHSAVEKGVIFDWIVEILSPQQSANQVIKKVLFCLHQGTSLGWLIDPEDESNR